MLEGITVLSEYMSRPSVVLNVILIVLGILLIISGIVFLILSVNNGDVKEVAMSLIFCFVMGIGSILIGSMPDKGETLYKVTIDKSVSYIELTEKYDVICHDGQIYTIREKDKIE